MSEETVSAREMYRRLDAKDEEIKKLREEIFNLAKWNRKHWNLRRWCAERITDLLHDAIVSQLCSLDLQRIMAALRQQSCYITACTHNREGSRCFVCVLNENSYLACSKKYDSNGDKEFKCQKYLKK